MNEIENHAGQELPEDSDFFATAPKEIGVLLSAHTTMKKNDNPSGGLKRMVVAAAGTGVGLLVGLGITHVAGLTPERVPFYLWAIGMPLFGLVAGREQTAFRHTCSYVGEDGLAEYTLKKSRKRHPHSKVLRFDDAESLHVTLVDHYGNAFYEKTTYAYEWKGRRGTACFKIEGSYCEKSGPPKDPCHPFHFGAASEDAWNDHKLDKMVATIENGGHVPFQVDGMTLEMGLGSLYIYDGERRLKWDINHIDSVSLRDGSIIVYSDRYRASGAISQLFGNGTIRFSYGSMPNAQLFMLLLKLLLGKSEAA